jgi:hypothetical protein
MARVSADAVGARCTSDDLRIPVARLDQVVAGAAIGPAAPQDVGRAAEQEQAPVRALEVIATGGAAPRLPAAVAV